MQIKGKVPMQKVPATTFPFLAVSSKSLSGWLVTGCSKDNSKVWEGICLFDQADIPLFRAGGFCDDLSSPNLHKVDSLTLYME